MICWILRKMEKPGMQVTTVVASALIRNKAGSYLIFEDRGGFAALPGGSTELAETPDEAAVRESFEETGLRVSIEKLVTQYDLIVLNKDRTEKCRFLHYLFLASTKDSEPRLGCEWQKSGARCRWIKLGSLRRYRGVWPLTEEVKIRISEGLLDLGNLGTLKYQMK